MIQKKEVKKKIKKKFGSRNGDIKQQQLAAIPEQLLVPHQAAVQAQRSLSTAEISHRQKDPGKDVEADGQGGEIVSTEQNEFEKFAALHTRHPARHISTTPPDLLQVRGPNAPAALK